MRAIVRLSILGMLLTAVGVWAQTSAPDLNTIVNRMQTAMAGRNHDLAYSVTREYTLSPQNAAKSSRVVAQVNTLPSGKKDYAITEGGGQAENVVRKVLDHETEISASHNNVDINATNYQFSYLGTDVIDGHRCYVLGLKPHHEAKEFLSGKAWVDADSYLIRQVSGSPTKSPSWWVKDVQVTLHYREVQGVWLQDSGEAIAQVRIVGPHTLTSRALNVSTATDFASNKPVVVPASRKHNRRPVDPALLGSGVFQHH